MIHILLLIEVWFTFMDVTFLGKLTLRWRLVCTNCIKSTSRYGGSKSSIRQWEKLNYNGVAKMSSATLEWGRPWIGTKGLVSILSYQPVLTYTVTWDEDIIWGQRVLLSCGHSLRAVSKWDTQKLEDECFIPDRKQEEIDDPHGNQNTTQAFPPILRQGITKP